ncbi:unnamed protein product [Leptosia nina]|uniref:Uncharacterized protein n=1 Tax=Leptosia nina TaxID=320188 RepID=A0AAV1IWH4_9NEOP
MTPFYFMLALIIQSSLIYAEIGVSDGQNSTNILGVAAANVFEDDQIVKGPEAAPLDWMDIVLSSPTPIYPTSSSTLMAQAVLSDKPPEEQLEEIKEMANQITMAIQSEMVNLLSYAVSATDAPEGNTLRKKRSIESPLDSTQLVMRLLKHIKSNNDYQNIAIEKMMSAQEIADKYNIPFKADPDILSDFALAGSEQAQELTSILQDVCDLNANQTVISKNNTIPQPKNSTESYCTDHPIDDRFIYTGYNSEPAHHYSPVTPRPTFYDTISYQPEDVFPFCAMEPMTSVILEPIESEPKCTGEEIEETISSKIYVKDDEEPGSMSVNHVMTYSVAESTHFRKPHIETLPQQMQYYFFLM